MSPFSINAIKIKPSHCNRGSLLTLTLKFLRLGWFFVKSVQWIKDLEQQSYHYYFRSNQPQITPSSKYSCDMASDQLSRSTMYQSKFRILHAWRLPKILIAIAGMKLTTSFCYLTSWTNRDNIISAYSTRRVKENSRVDVRSGHVLEEAAKRDHVWRLRNHPDPKISLWSLFMTQRQTSIILWVCWMRLVCFGTVQKNAGYQEDAK